VIGEVWSIRCGVEYGIVHDLGVTGHAVDCVEFVAMMLH
jgi:hypothetical protein